MSGQPMGNSMPNPVATPSPAQGEVSRTLLCPKCGRQVDSLRCGHCGSSLPDWQAALYGAAIRAIARTGGSRTDTASKGGKGSGNGQPDPENGARRQTNDARQANGMNRENADGEEFDETAADDIKQAECPYCGRSFPI